MKRYITKHKPEQKVMINGKIYELINVDEFGIDYLSEQGPARISLSDLEVVECQRDL